MHIHNNFISIGLFSPNLSGHVNGAKLLIDNGADVNPTDNIFELSPLYLTIQKGNFQSF